MSVAFKPKTMPVVLFLGDTEAQIEQLRRVYRREQQAALVMADAPRRQGDPAAGEDAERAAAAYNDFVTAAEADPERSMTVWVTAVGRKAWRAMVKDNPVRMVPGAPNEDGSPGPEEPHEDDTEWGFNFETLPEDLIPASIEEKYRDEDFLDGLSIGQWNRLYSASVELNTGVGIDPKVRLRFFGIDQMSDETSR